MSNFRTIVVDDGSRDNTMEVISGFKKVYVLRHLSNRGLPAACNTGLKHVETEYFLRLDADDRLSHTALSMLLKRMELGDTDLVFSDRMDNNQYVDLSDLPRDYPFYFARTLPRLVAGGILFKTQIVKDIGGYNDLFWEEFDLLIRYLAQSRKPLGYVPRALYHYTRRKDSMTKGTGTISGWLEQQS